MPRNDVVEARGRVIAALPDGSVRVRLDNGHAVLAHVAGSMRLHYVKVTAGDRVTVELSPFDLARGRITDRTR